MINKLKLQSFLKKKFYINNKYKKVIFLTSDWECLYNIRYKSEKF